MSLTLMLFCFSSCVMFPVLSKKGKKCCTISWFIFWGMLKQVNDFCYSDNLHMKSFVPKWDIYLLKQGKPAWAEWLTAETWKQDNLLTFLLAGFFLSKQYWMLRCLDEWMYSILELKCSYSVVFLPLLLETFFKLYNKRKRTNTFWRHVKYLSF